MAFFQLVLKARKIEKARRSYEDEKLTSISISKGAKYPYTIRQRIRRRKLWLGPNLELLQNSTTKTKYLKHRDRLKKKVKNVCNRILVIPKGTWLYRKYVAITTDGTLENYVAKSFLGFVGGIFLTYIFFIFFVFQLNFKLSSATFICTILGVILTIGLAFSLKIRCIVFLILPQFFSKRGRQALMAYAFILALTGPVKNILHNTAVLSESLACAQGQLKEAVKAIIDLAKQPFYALRDAISKVIKTIKVIVKRIKQTLIAIKRLVLSILRVITSVFQWLGSIINICNKKLGTPFDRCQRVFEGAVADCKAKLGPIFGFVCNITYVVSSLCYIVKPLDFICMLVSYIADTVVGAVRRKIKKFTTHMKAMFYVKVKFSHSFHYEANQSKTIQEVSTSIAKEVRSRTDKLFEFFDWMSFVTSFLFMFILLRALRYRYKWLTSDRFDNRYITNDLRTIDLIRTRQDKETVLPLNPRERNRYVPLTSMILIKSERIKLTRSLVFLGIATMKLLAYMSLDYSLHWVLNTIQLYGRFHSKVEQPSVVTIHVSGNGYLAELYRSIAKAFTPHGKEAEVDTILCLPDPLPPNLDKYIQIIVLIFFCWLIVFFEPYGLRLRHVVLCQYYPDRAKQRAAWLYNHIIRSRGSFLKFARRQLRRKFGLNGEQIDKVTFRERLWAVIPCLNILFPLKQRMCLLCGAVERADDNSHIKCPTPGCIGLFCVQCFADLQNLCTICRSPIEYGDLTDMSEEKDSSEDQFETPKKILQTPEAKEEEPESKDEDEPEFKDEQEPELKDEEEPLLKEDEERDKDVADETEPSAADEEEEAHIEAIKAEKEKDVANQTDDRYAKDLDRTSDSDYSYTYQDESPVEAETEKGREPFKDVEAQKIRDDVTIQIFNDPLARESCSSSEPPTSCFVVRARRKVCAKLKKRPASRVCRGKDSDSSTSIADTESWSTEEVDEEEVVHIEVDDSSEELLPKDRTDKAKRGRINRIVDAVARIPWLGKGEDNGRGCRGLQERRPSLMNRIVSMLHTKQSMPVQSYRRTRKLKDSSSSSSCSCDDEKDDLLKMRDKRCTYLTRRKSRRAATEDDYDEIENLKRLPCRKAFVTKQLPRHLESTVKGTCYYEVDETEDSQTQKCVRQVEDINDLSGISAPTHGRMGDERDTRRHDKLGPYSSEMTLGTTEATDAYSSRMRTISEQTDSTSKPTSETETEATTKSETDYSKERELPIKPLKQQKHTKDESPEYEESKDLEQTETEEGDQKEFTEKQGVKLSIVPEEIQEVVAPTKEIEDETKPEEKVTLYTDTEISRVPDPSPGLEIFGVGHGPRRKRRRPVEQELTFQEKVADSEALSSKEKSKDTAEKSEVLEEEVKSQEEPKSLGHEPKPSEVKSSISKEEYAVPLKDVKEDESKLPAEEPIEIGSPTKRTKIDKATDPPDRSRSTQTKFHKRGSRIKDTEQDAKMSGVKRSSKGAKKLYRDKKREKRCREKRKLQDRYKTKCDKCRKSKKRKCSCSDKSTFTDDEECYFSTHRSKQKRSEWDAEECDPFENKYSPRNYNTDYCTSSVVETSCGVHRSGHPEIMKETFEMPVIKKYLPIYQSPELIDELKRHDRIRLIQEKEAKRRKFERTPRSPDSISINSPMEDDRFPYQGTRTYKNESCELPKRTGNQKNYKNEKERVPLIRLSKEADKSKNVKQLYPREDHSGVKCGLMKRLSHKIIAPFKPSKKDKCKGDPENIRTERIRTVCYDCPYSPEIMSDVCSTCSCAKEVDKFECSTSADE